MWLICETEGMVAGVKGMVGGGGTGGLGEMGMERKRGGEGRDGRWVWRGKRGDLWGSCVDDFGVMLRDLHYALLVCK